MKRLSRILQVILLWWLVASCGQSSENIKIGLLVPAGEGYRWPTDMKYIEKACADQNIEIVSRIADNNENLQLKHATELLAENVDALIVVPVNSNTAGGVVRAANEAKVPVIAYDRLIKNCELDYFITFNGARIGELMLEHAINKKPKGNYVFLWGDASDVNALSIKQAQEKLIAPLIDKGDINIVYKTYVENWSRDNAKHQMKRILDFANEPIDAVITSYDGLASGVLDAYQELGLEPPTVLTGQDAELEALQNIVKGDMSLTVYKSIPTMAKSAVDLAVKLAMKNEIKNVDATIYNGRKEVVMFQLDPKPVGKGQIESIVVSDNLYTREEIYAEL